MGSAENEIVSLGGQQPPPTGNLVVDPVQWTNLTEISFGYLADPSNDGSSRGQGNAPVKLIALQNINLSGTIMPSGTILHGVGTGGSSDELIRIEDPNDPRDYPYTNSNRNTGTWDWENWSDRGITWEYAKLEKVVSGGSVQVNGNGGIEKIAGAGGFNAGASSTNFIEGNSNGYVQFQWGVEFKSQKIGLTYLDLDYGSISPFELNINGNGHVFTNGSNQFSGGAGWASQGDYFRIRHFASDNTIRFQKREEIFDNGASIGTDYVTFHTHSELTNGNNLYVDTSLVDVGSRLNDVLLAR